MSFLTKICACGQSVDESQNGESQQDQKEDTEREALVVLGYNSSLPALRALFIRHILRDLVKDSLPVHSGIEFGAIRTPPARSPRNHGDHPAGLDVRFTGFAPVYLDLPGTHRLIKVISDPCHILIQIY